MSTVQIAIRIAMMMFLIPAVLFISAGRLDLPFFWAYTGLLVIGITCVLQSIDRDLLQERVRPGPGGHDRGLRLVMMMLAIPQLIVAGLDVGRFHWSDSVPASLRIAGLVIQAASMALVVWTMRTNPFFSPVVRIQTERGHRLISSGPYRVIRHPGYLTSLLMIVSGALVLGSWWSMVPAIPMAGMILRRTLLEDRFLRMNLPGYPDYARRVSSRLVPGLW